MVGGRREAAQRELAALAARAATVDSNAAAQSADPIGDDQDIVSVSQIVHGLKNGFNRFASAATLRALQTPVGEDPDLRKAMVRAAKRHKYS